MNNIDLTKMSIVDLYKALDQCNKDLSNLIETDVVAVISLKNAITKEIEKREG